MKARWPLFLLTLLVGCEVGPDYKAPTTPEPARWTTGRSGHVSELKSWWRNFKDPLLNELVEQAIIQNANVAQAVAKLRQARASLRQEQAGLFPNIEASGNVTASRQSLEDLAGVLPGTNGLSGITSSTFETGFDASFELDLFGGQRRAVESASATLEATSADFASTLLTLLGDVARYYVEARGSKTRIAAAKDTLSSRIETLQLTQSKARAGTGSELDAIRAQAEMENARAAIPPLESDYRRSVDRIAVLTGNTSQQILNVMRTDRPIPRLAGTIQPDPPAIALARRPDIQAAERRIAAATADIGAADADRYPAVTLAGSLGINSTRIRSLVSASSLVWSLGPQFDLPVFDAGKRAAKVAEKVAVRDEQVEAWRATVREAIEEVENALTGLDREWAHNEAAHRAVDSYGEAAELAQAQYQAGLDTFLDVLDADRSLASARDNAAQSDAALAVDAIALYKALGGGWEEGISHKSKPDIQLNVADREEAH